MTFFSEPRGYEKTILSDLQGAWECLRTAALQALLSAVGFPLAGVPGR
jgi:hypothetical protein